MTLELKPVSPNDLRDVVERDHNYSLAYYHYDFPDDVYWLGPLLVTATRRTTCWGTTKRGR